MKSNGKLQFLIKVRNIRYAYMGRNLGLHVAACWPTKSSGFPLMVAKEVVGSGVCDSIDGGGGRPNNGG